MDETIKEGKSVDSHSAFYPIALLKEGFKEGINKVGTSVDHVIHGKGTTDDYLTLVELAFGVVVVGIPKKHTLEQKKQ